MRIPEKVKIGAHIFNVVIESELAESHGKVGQSKISIGKILIEPQQSQSQIEDTLIHEILHCINSQVEFVGKDQDIEEAAVSRLSPLLLQVIRDNKEIFE